MTELVMRCRGPGRQAGAARPDLVNAAMLPSAQPLKHLRSRRSRSRLRARAPPGRNSNAASCQAAVLGRGHAVQPVNADAHPLPVAAQSCISSRCGAPGQAPIGHLAPRPGGDPRRPRILL